MEPVVMLLAILVLLVIWLYMRSRRNMSSPKSDAARPAAKKNTEFHAVSIRFSPTACNAAKALSGERFLASAAPTVPLPKCDATSCDCHFGHHLDRRARKNRRSPFATAISTDGTGSFQVQRRDGEGRRDDDEIE
jgi:hypothetical protein